MQKQSTVDFKEEKEGYLHLFNVRLLYYELLLKFKFNILYTF